MISAIAILPRRQWFDASAGLYHDFVITALKRNKLKK
jgi:hypothetical protein